MTFRQQRQAVIEPVTEAIALEAWLDETCAANGAELREADEEAPSVYSTQPIGQFIIS